MNDINPKHPVITKNIIIGGVPRSGKSILARKISADLGYSHYPIDSWVSSFNTVFPGLGITHYEEEHQAVSKRLWPFLSSLIKHLAYENLSYVLEGFHIRPADVHRHLDPSRWQILFMGYPAVKVDDMVRRIRGFARVQDWTEELDDRALSALIARYIKESQSIQDDCKKFGLRFVDTSFDFYSTLDRLNQDLSQAVRMRE